MKRCKFSLLASIPALALVFAFALTGFVEYARAADATTRNAEADAARLEAEAKAESRLGYPDTYDMFVGGGNRTVDFYALSQQIARLAAIMRAFSQTIDPGGASSAPGLGPMPAGDPRTIYGPDGPTAKSVQLILEYRLMVAGNPRLKAGDVREEKNRVIAQVVTTEGSLVEQYAINKKTGAWEPIR